MPFSAHPLALGRHALTLAACGWLTALSAQILPGAGPRAPVGAGLQYEIASIKEADPQHLEFTGAMDSPDGIHAVDPVKGLTAYALHMRNEFVICKLPLCEKPLFDVKTRVSTDDQVAFAGLSYDSKRALLLPVLKERFGLVTHNETQAENVYELVVAKSGPKLKPPPPPGSPESKRQRSNGAISIFGDRIRGDGVDLDTLTLVLSGFLAQELGRPVLNKTGLGGTYDIDLLFTPTAKARSSINGQMLENTSKDPENSGGSIFTALHDQLGLEMKPAREPVPVLVIDAVHAPTSD